MNPDILAHVQEAALAADLPISLVYGLVCQESSGNPNATRFEPMFFQRYIIKGNFPEAEGKGRATSWGLMQIMGEVAREEGFKGDFHELLEPEVGLYWGCRHLARLKERYWAKYGWNGVLAAYNAGSPRLNGGKFVNQKYVDGVLGYASEERG